MIRQTQADPESEGGKGNEKAQAPPCPCGCSCPDLLRLEGRLAALENVMAGALDFHAERAPGAGGALPPLTTKQHATLQMLIEGASNRQIAERFGVTVNTAKVHVRSLFAKFNVNTRASVARLGREAIARIEGADYLRLSGGLPSSWAREYGKQPVESDPFAPLYLLDNAGESGGGEDD